MAHGHFSFLSFSGRKLLRSPIRGYQQTALDSIELAFHDPNFSELEVARVKMRPETMVLVVMYDM